LARNSAALLLVHNHPSGAAEPSRSDETLTQMLKSALALVDVRVPSFPYRPDYRQKVLLAVDRCR
jgi:DNA repair protein RadC